MKLDPAMQKRTIDFIRKNAAAKKPFYVDYWPIATSFLGFHNRVTASGGLSQEALARLDVWIGSLMSELKNLGIAENTLGQRFLGSNHIRRRRRVCMTKCG